MSQTYLLQNLPTNIMNGYREHSEISSLFDNLKLSGGALETQDGGLSKKDPAKEAKKQKKKDIKTCKNYKRDISNIEKDIEKQEKKERIAKKKNKPKAEKKALEKQDAYYTKLDEYKKKFETNNPDLKCDTVLADKKANTQPIQEDREETPLNDTANTQPIQEDREETPLNDTANIQDEMNEEKRKKEQDLINDNISSVFHTVARSNSPFWCSNLGITILTIFFGYSYQILINNEDFLMWAIWGFGLIFIIFLRIVVGLLRRGNMLEKKIRHSYTALLSFYVMSFFVAYWTYQLYNPSAEDKKPCNKNASWNKKFSIFMSVLYGFLIFSVDRHLSRYPTKDVKKGIIIGLLSGLGAFGAYLAVINQ